MSELSSALSDLKVAADIFSEVKYYLSGKVTDKVLQLLKDGGAEHKKHFDFCTHCIVGEGASDSDISSAKDLYEVPAVTQEWVIRSAQYGKLLPTKAFSAEPNQLFSGVVATLSGLCKEDFNIVWAMVTFYGGKILKKLDSTCTHLITGKPSGAKYEAALEHNVIAVTPDWVVDCVRTKSKCDTTSFHPSLLVLPRPRTPTPPPVLDKTVSLITGFADDGVNSESSAGAQVQKVNSVSTVVTPESKQDQKASLLEQLKQRMPWNQPISSPSTPTAGPPPPLVSTAQQQNLQRVQQQPQQQNVQLMPIQQLTQQQFQQLTAHQQQQYIQRMQLHQQQLQHQQQQLQQQASSASMPVSTQSQQVLQQGQVLQTSNPPTLNQNQLIQTTSNGNIMSQTQIVQATTAGNVLPQTSVANALGQQPLVRPAGQTLGQQTAIMTSMPSNSTTVLQQQKHQNQQQQGQSPQQQRVIQQIPMQQGVQWRQTGPVQQTQVATSQAQQTQQVQVVHKILPMQQQQQQQFILRDGQLQQLPQQHYTLTVQRDASGNPLSRQQQQQFHLQRQQQLQQRQVGQTSQAGQIIQVSQAGQSGQIIVTQAGPQTNQITPSNSVVQQGATAVQPSQPTPQPGQNVQKQPGQVVQQVSQQVVQPGQVIQPVQLNQQIPGQLQQRQVAYTQQQTQGPPRRFIQLDAQTHAHLQQMDPQQRSLFIQKIEKQRQIILQRQVQQRQLLQGQPQQQIIGVQQTPQQTGQNQIISGMQQPQISQGQIVQGQVNQVQLQQGQISQGQVAQQGQALTVIRAQMPPGLNPQQQVIWMQQRDRQMLLQQQQINQNPQLRQQMLVPQQIEVQQTQSTSAPATPVATPASTASVPQPPQSAPPQVPANSVIQQQPGSTWVPSDTTAGQPATSQQQQQQQFALIRQQQLRLQQIQMQREAAQKQQQVLVVGQRMPGVPYPSQGPGTLTIRAPLQSQQVQVQQTIQVPVQHGQQIVTQSQGQPTTQHQSVQQTVQAQQTVQTVQQQTASLQTGQQTIQQSGVLGSINANDDSSANSQEQYQLQGEGTQSIPITQPAAMPPPLPAAVPATMPGQSLVNSKTKTALANMLSNRLNGGGGQQHASQLLAPEGSAAGQLRLMTAQHHAAQQQQQQHQQQAAQLSPQQLLAFQQQQRRTLGNITNNSTGVAVAVGPSGGISPVRAPGVPVPVAGAPGIPGAPTAPLTQQQAAALAAKRANQIAVKSSIVHPQQHPQQRVQYYGHNPNIKLSPDMCLLGCVFFIVEYDKGYSSQLNNWRTIIREHGGEEELTYVPRITHVLCETQRNIMVQQALRDGKRCVTASWLSDIIAKKQLLPPSIALHLPTIFGDEKPCRNMIISHSGFEGEDRARVRFMIDAVGAKRTSYYSQQNNILVCRKPDGAKYRQAREWNKTVVNVQWLNEVMLSHFSGMVQPESPKFQQFNIKNPFYIDPNLVTHLMAAWKMPINVTQEAYDRAKNSVSPRRKRPRLDAEVDQENMKYDDGIIAAALAGQERREGMPIILLSHVDNPKKLELIEKVKELGGSVTTTIREATHLVMSKLQRTVKFFCSVSHVRFVLSEEWITESFSQKQFLEEEKYMFCDQSFESANSFNLRQLLATPNRSTLFQGKIFYITPGVVPSPKSLTDMIEHAGGIVERHRRSLKQIQELNANGIISTPSSAAPITENAVPTTNSTSNVKVESASAAVEESASVVRNGLSSSNLPNGTASLKENISTKSMEQNDPTSLNCRNSSEVDNLSKSVDTTVPLVDVKIEPMDVEISVKSEIPDANNEQEKKNGEIPKEMEIDTKDESKEKEMKNELKQLSKDCPKSTKDVREKDKNEKREPVYLVVSVLNDLHLVSDLMRAKIGIYNAEFVMKSILQQKMDHCTAIFEEDNNS